MPPSDSVHAARTAELVQPYLPIAIYGCFRDQFAARADITSVQVHPDPIGKQALLFEFSFDGEVFTSPCTLGTALVELVRRKTEGVSKQRSNFDGWRRVKAIWKPFGDHQGPDAEGVIMKLEDLFSMPVRHGLQTWDAASITSLGDHHKLKALFKRASAGENCILTARDADWRNTLAQPAAGTKAKGQRARALRSRARQPRARAIAATQGDAHLDLFELDTLLSPDSLLVETMPDAKRARQDVAPAPQRPPFTDLVIPFLTMMPNCNDRWRCPERLLEYLDAHESLQMVSGGLRQVLRTIAQEYMAEASSTAPGFAIHRSVKV